MESINITGLLQSLYFIAAAATFVTAYRVYDKAQKKARKTGGYVGFSHADNTILYCLIAGLWPIGLVVLYFIWRQELRENE